MLKVGVIIQRFGSDICGGAEFSIRMYIESLADQFEFDVLTSRSSTIGPWKNDLPEEEIVKLPASEYRIRRFRCATSVVQVGDSCFLPNLPGLEEYLLQHQSDYDVFIVCTYLFGTTITASRVLKGKPVVFVPFSHNEIIAYDDVFSGLFNQMDLILFQTIEEYSFAKELYDLKTSCRIIGLVLDDKPADDVVISEKVVSAAEQNYFLYVGRIVKEKGIFDLYEAFKKFKKKNQCDLKLCICGKPSEPVDFLGDEDVLYLGFVTEAEKRYLLKRARFLANPSLYESFSLVVLEAWSEKIPVLVNGGCEVLKGQCVRSGGGLYYYDDSDLIELLGRFVNDPGVLAKMGESGYCYYKKCYDKVKMVGQFKKSIEAVAALKS